MAKRLEQLEAPPCPERVRVDLREKYRYSYLHTWEYRYLSAQHCFVPSFMPNVVRLSFSHLQPHQTQAGMVIDSEDGGATWRESAAVHRQPPSNLGYFRSGQYHMALFGANTAWISIDGGDHWYKRPVLGAEDLHMDGLGAPNCFSAIMITQGVWASRIVMVADYFLDQEGPDGQLLCAMYSDDWGATWHASRLFGAPDPLPKAPEGFGEPAVVQLPSGWLWMVFRTLYGELWQCLSKDGGASWTRPTPTGLASPIANCYAAREPTTGATVLCWNHTRPGTGLDFNDSTGVYRPRTNLVFAVSRDNTRTWTVPVVVEAAGGVYPTIHFAAGRMFIMYQSSGAKPCAWHEMGLTLVAYDIRDVLALPAWTTETIRPLIEQGLVAHWRAMACQAPSRQTIS